MARSEIGRRRLEQVEAGGDLLGQLGGTERAHPGGRQLESQGHAIEQIADPSDVRPVIVGHAQVCR